MAQPSPKSKIQRARDHRSMPPKNLPLLLEIDLRLGRRRAFYSRLRQALRNAAIPEKRMVNVAKSR